MKSNRSPFTQMPLVTVLAVVLALGVASESLATPVLDQSSSSAVISSTNATNTNPRGQTFTVGLTGILTQIDLEVNGDNSTIVLDVMSVSGGLPTGIVLASATNPTDAGGTKTFDLSAASLNVTVGEVLAFIISGPGLYGYQSTADTYAGGTRVSSNNSGASWILNSTTDSNFSTFVEVVPEPSTGLLLGIALLGVAASGRRRRA